MRIIGQKPILNVAYYGTNVLVWSRCEERVYAQTWRAWRERTLCSDWPGWCKEMIFVFCFRINVFYKKAFSIKFYFVL